MKIRVETPVDWDVSVTAGSPEKEVSGVEGYISNESLPQAPPIPPTEDIPEPPESTAQVCQSSPSTRDLLSMDTCGLDDNLKSTQQDLGDEMDIDSPSKKLEELGGSDVGEREIGSEATKLTVSRPSSVF